MPFTSCDCSLCPNGAPQQYTIHASGFSNTGFCGNCTQLNADWVVTFLQESGTCQWKYTISPAICFNNSWLLEISGSADNQKHFKVTLGTNTWENSSVAGCRPDSVTLTKTSSDSFCTCPNTITVTPVGFNP